MRAVRLQKRAQLKMRVHHKKLIPLTLFAATLPGIALAQDLMVHGNFRHMMHTGETGGTIVLDTVTAPSAWGVGLLPHRHVGVRLGRPRCRRGRMRRRCILRRARRRGDVRLGM